MHSFNRQIMLGGLGLYFTPLAPKLEFAETRI
jgi:hypothetical protein